MKTTTHSCTHPLFFLKINTNALKENRQLQNKLSCLTGSSTSLENLVTLIPHYIIVDNDSLWNCHPMCQRWSSAKASTTCKGCTSFTVTCL